MNSFTLYADMFRYFARPCFEIRRDRLTPDGVAAVLGLICLVFLSLIPLTFLQGLFFAVSGAGTPEPSRAFRAMNESPSFVVLAVILAPVFEELLFRSWLGFRRGVLLVMPTLLVLFALIGALPRAEPSALALFCVMISCFAALAYGLRWLSVNPGEAAQDAILAFVFPTVFWGTAIMFGAMHHANFAPDYPIWALPIALLPLIFAGGALGYVRMRFGLFIGMFFHGGYNALILTVSTLIMVGTG